MHIALALAGVAAQAGTVGAVADIGVGEAGIGTAAAVTDPATVVAAGPASGLTGRVEATAGAVDPAAVTAAAVVDPAAAAAAMGVAGAVDRAE